MKKHFFYFTLIVIIGIGFAGCSALKNKNKIQNKPLVGTVWNAVKINKVDIPAVGSAPYILFAETGNFNGSTGCNKYFGTFILNKKTISMENSGATKKLCANMEIERLYLGALKKEINYYTIIGDTLVLYEKTTEVLRFIANNNPEPQE
jgi:heat shock protein HslJ